MAHIDNKAACQYYCVLNDLGLFMKMAVDNVYCVFVVSSRESRQLVGLLVFRPDIIPLYYNVYGGLIHMYCVYFYIILKDIYPEGNSDPW